LEGKLTQPYLLAGNSVDSSPPCYWLPSLSPALLQSVASLLTRYGFVPLRLHSISPSAFSSELTDQALFANELTNRIPLQPPIADINTRPIFCRLFSANHVFHSFLLIIPRFAFFVGIPRFFLQTSPCRLLEGSCSAHHLGRDPL